MECFFFFLVDFYDNGHNRYELDTVLYVMSSSTYHFHVISESALRYRVYSIHQRINVVKDLVAGISCKDRGSLS